MINGLQIESLQFKNFMSVGNVLQTINFENGNMRIITGEDLGSQTLKRSGIGKAQPLYSKVRVKNGWETIGNIGIGDTVVTPTGVETIVTGVYPQGKKDVFTITFEDGRKVKACKEHLWKVKTPSGWSIINTESIMDIIKNGSTPSIPLIEDDCDELYKLPFSPYFLTLCLLSGEINSAGYITLQVFDEDISYQVEYELRNHPNVSVMMTKKGIVIFDEGNSIGTAVQDFLLPDNDIHQLFLNELSFQQRTECIKAILDVYAYETDDGQMKCVFSEMERNHATLLQRLVWTVGGIAEIKKNILSDEIFNIQEEYHVTLKFKNPNLYLTILHKKVFESNPELSLSIKSVKFDKPEECVCISVLSNEKLYVTDGYVVTHNTTVPNALSYALYNKPVSKIKTARLPNTTNKKNMFVRVDFKKDGRKYYIERGMKPDIFKFVEVLENEEKDRNDTQGTKNDTQVNIEKILGMSHDLFTMLVTVNTINDCFMRKPLSKQRDIIEEILNISELTRKAKILSEYRIKESKSEIDKEKVRIEAHITMKQRAEHQLSQAKKQFEQWNIQYEKKLVDLYTKLDTYQQINIDDEIKLHTENELITEQQRRRRELINEINSTSKLVDQGTKRLTEINTMLTSFSENKCPTCEQEIPDESHKDHESKLITEATEYFEVLEISENSLNELKVELESIPDNDLHRTSYRNINDAYNHQHAMNNISENITALESETNPHQETVDSAEKLLDDSKVDYETLEGLEKRLNHQLFLQKMLTGRDSFIRKRIIDISLPVLNQNIEKYLRSTNIRHEMKFQSDLTLEIFKSGNEYDFDQLSRGEQNWAIISLNLAMRDLYEDLSGTVNLLFVDELIDFGLDLGQSIDAFAILKGMTRDREKSVSLITHREELFEKADDILYTTMENDFTSYDIRKN